MGLTNTPSDLLPGTLELLILKALVGGAKHGYGIVEHLRLASDDVQRLGQSRVGRLGEQPPRTLLHGHRRRPETIDRRTRRVRSHGWRDSARAGNDLKALVR